MKFSKIQMFTIKFESIWMQEDGTFSAFYYELRDIVNSSFNHGENIPQSKVVRKILRSFNGVSLDEFLKITTCKCAKEVRDILSVTYMGALAMKFSKIQMVTIKFESIRMQENTTFPTFYFELRDIATQALTLGRKFHSLRY